MTSPSFVVSSILKLKVTPAGTAGVLPRAGAPCLWDRNRSAGARRRQPRADSSPSGATSAAATPAFAASFVCSAHCGIRWPAGGLCLESSSMPLAGMPIQIRPYNLFSKRCAPVVVPHARQAVQIASFQRSAMAFVAGVLVDRDLVAQLAVEIVDESAISVSPVRRRSSSGNTALVRLRLGSGSLGRGFVGRLDGLLAHSFGRAPRQRGAAPRKISEEECNQLQAW
jgi:hypothetical protein